LRQSLGNHGENTIKETTRRFGKRPKLLRSGPTNSHDVVKYAVLTFAMAALCLFAGWAATNASSSDAVVKGSGHSSGHAPAADESPASARPAGNDYSIAPANYGIERYSTWGNADGKSATYQPEGPFTADNTFFKPLGSNGRACATCHDPSAGWTITPVHIRARFEASHGTDPLFRPLDGATCSDADVSTQPAMKKAYGLLLNKGLIRIARPIPTNAEFSVIKVDDPYHCTKLSSPRSGVLSVYRRPLQATNLRFETTIMWDGRMPDLEHQANDAAHGHEQAVTGPMPDQLARLLEFESGTYDAQVWLPKAGSLQDGGVGGGPVALSRQEFFVGINDPFNNNPTGLQTTLHVFNLYDLWRGDPNPERARIARGQEIFNTTPMIIGGVPGLDDAEDHPTHEGFCTTCHDTPNIGNRSINILMNIGTADATRRTPDMPLFTLRCDAGALKGQTFEVIDPGQALITGKCADIGRFKTSSLRGLASRPPYFHDGQSATLMDVVNFYNDRFQVGLTGEEKDDLVAFLKTL
jgi:cytochrome c peroxidase